jgi:hypothetical protein
MRSATATIKRCSWVIFSLIAVPAHASELDQATKVIFSNAVEVPGTVLQPGTYRFVLANSDSDRDIVQIFSADRTKLYATLNTVPKERREITTETAFTFAERPADKPEAILTWFYPGNTTGHEFLYSRNEEKELATDTHDTIVSSGFAGGH